MTLLTREDLLEAALAARQNTAVQHEREELSDSLSKFIAQAWKVLKPQETFRDNWHIHAIAEHLEAVSRGDIKRLQIWIPPGTSKSLTVSVFWPAWEWTFAPHLRYWGASYEVGLAGRLAAMSRDLMLDLWYQERWGDMFEFIREGERVFGNDKGGTRLATAPNSTGSGEHGHRILIDDPINAKSADATSRVTLDMTNDWYDGTVVTRGIGNDHARVIIMQRLHLCLPPDARVRTPTGAVPICELQPNDDVLTSSGTQKVVAVTSRPHRGSLINIRTYGHCEWFRSTDNHRILTTRGWVNAGEITTSDTLVFKTPTTNDPVYPSWPKHEGTNKITARQGTFTGSRGKVPPAEEVQALVDEGLSVQKIAQRLGYKSRGSVHNALMFHGIERPSSRPVSRKILHDLDFWWFVGLWLAEGCVTKNRGKYSHVRLTVHVKERHMIERVAAMLERHGMTLTSADSGNVIQASIFSRQIGKFLRQFGTNARNKIVPEWSNSLPEDALKEMFSGYWQGDGCLTTNKRGTHLARAVSSSLDLIEGWQRSLLRVGVRASVMRAGKEGSMTMDGEKFYETSPSWELRLPLSDAPWLAPDIVPLPPMSMKLSLVGGELHLPVRSIEVSEYHGDVWDIETPCHDFLTGSVTAHNSDLASHVLDLEEWEVLCLPERFEEKHPFVWPNDPRTVEGELLWPDHRNETASTALARALTSHRAAGQLQQRPSALEGDLLKRDWWRFYDSRVRDTNDWSKLPFFSSVVQSVDCPLKDREANDNVACQLWGIKGADRYLLDLKLGKMNYQSAKRTVKEQAVWARKTWPRCRHHLLIENAGYGVEMITDLKREITGVTKISVGADGDKVMRATTASDALESGNCFLPGFGPPWQPAYDEAKTPADVVGFIQSCAAFPNATHDDDVDAWSMVMNWLRGRVTSPMRTASAFKRR